jgi:outer membrane cobalamin receptor
VNAFPVNFDLKTQTSRDIEGGFRGRLGGFEWQSSVYDMELNNEILFIPFPPIGRTSILIRRAASASKTAHLTPLPIR